MSDKNYKQKIGAWGEALAEKYYHDQGWQTVAKNYRIFCGELDLIFQKAGQILAVEVKTRSNQKYGWAEECLNPAKIERLQNACLEAQEKLNLAGQWQIEILIIDIRNNKAQIRRRRL